MNEEIIKFNNQLFAVDYLDEAGKSVIAEIFKHKEYRRAEEAILLSSSGDFIIDAGAHLGFFAIFVRALNKKAKILCLEPNIKNFGILKSNINKNKLDSIESLNLGLTGESGERNFSFSDDSHDSKIIEDDSEDINFYKCKTISLTDLIKLKNIKKISLLKLDIEGAEFEVMNSINDNLKIVGNIILEYHDFEKNKHNEIEVFLRSKGFGVETFTSKFDKKLGFIFAHNKKIE